MICFVLAAFALVGSILLIGKATMTSDDTRRIIAISAGAIGTLNFLLLIFEIFWEVKFEIAMKKAVKPSLRENSSNV